MDLLQDMEAADFETRALASWEAGRAHWGLGETEAADSLLDLSLGLYREEDGEEGQAFAEMQSRYWALRGDREQSMEWFKEAIRGAGGARRGSSGIRSWTSYGTIRTTNGGRSRSGWSLGAEGPESPENPQIPFPGFPCHLRTHSAFCWQDPNEQLLWG